MRLWLLICSVLTMVGWIGHAAPANALAFSPDGSALISNGHKTLFVRAARDGRIQEEIPCEMARIEAVAFSADGKLAVVAGGEPGERGEALVMEWRGRKVIHRFTNFTDVVTCAAFSGNAKLLAVGSADRSVKIFRSGEDWTGTTTEFELPGHAGPVLGIAFSPGDRMLVSASADRSLKVWSIEEKRLVRSFNHHTDAVFDVVPRPGTELGEELFQMASGSADGTVRIWQPGIGRMVRIVRGHKGAVFALAYAPDGSHLYSAGAEGVVRKIAGESDRILDEWKAADDAIYALAMSPDGRTLATGAWDGTVKCWELSGGEKGE